MNPESSVRDPYLVKSVMHSSQLLCAFRVAGEALPLREISKRSNLPKTMAFRLLYTLEKCGMVEKVGENLYRSCLRPFKQKLYRLGYCAQGTEYGFSREVSASLQRWVKRRWESEADEIVLLELPRAGNLPRMRLTGLLVGIKEILPNLSNSRITAIDGDGCFDKSFEAVRKHLRSTTSRRIIVGAINDTSALGALRAFQEAGRTERCAIMSHNASLEGRVELREPHTRLVGSVGYFPERYGDDLIRVSLDILNRRPVPPAVFVKHQIITPETVDHFYPNDSLLRSSLGGNSGALAWSV